MHFLPDQYPPTFKKYLRVLFTGTTSYLLSLSFSLAYLSLFCWYTVLMRASASLLPCAMATADPAAQNTIIATIIPILNLELALSRVSMLQYRRDRETQEQQLLHAGCHTHYHAIRSGRDVVTWGLTTEVISSPVVLKGIASPSSLKNGPWSLQVVETLKGSNAFFWLHLCQKWAMMTTGFLEPRANTAMYVWHPLTSPCPTLLLACTETILKVSQHIVCLHPFFYGVSTQTEG